MRICLLRTGSRPGLTTDGPTGNADRARRMIALARAALLWERVWVAFWPGLGFLGLYAIAALLGILADLPWGLHAAVIVVLSGAATHSLWTALSAVEPPAWDEAARRVERDSDLAHRPLTESRDTLAAGAGDRVAESLWRAHRIRLLAAARRLNLRWPHPGLSRRDPYALRFLLLLGLLAAALVAGPDWSRRLVAGLAPATPASSAAVYAVLDAWIAPPAYTKQPPLYLPKLVSEGEGKPIAAPEGTQLILRARGLDAMPRLVVDPKPEVGEASAFATSGSGYEATIALASDTAVAVRASGRTLGSWRFSILPDAPPAIDFAEPPSASERDALKLAYKARDDYGVTKAEAEIRLALPDANAEDALILDLPLPASAKEVAETTFRDLTAHPFAGLTVMIRLVAFDAAEQPGASESMTMVLPERLFTHPLARALIEQRKTLTANRTGAQENVERALDALAIAPERFYAKELSTYLALRALYWQVKGIQDDPDRQAALAFMWDMALSMEDGDLSLAAADLRRLQQALMDALARGASDEEIARLMAELRTALDRYLRSLAQNAAPGDAPQPNARTLRGEDLDAILKAIEDLSRTGARDAARRLLAELQGLLENLRVAGRPQPTPAERALNDAVQGLADLMGAQRQLLDRTFRGQQGSGEGGEGALAGEQGALREQLDKILEGLGGEGVDAPQSLGRAGRAMEDSRDKLERHRLDESGDAQKDALDQLREGAQALARDLMQRMGENGAGEGEDMGNSDDRRDPLGRPRGATGPSLGGSVKVPEEMEIQRAREILNELRRRAAERARPQDEIDYIERLLKRF